MSLTVSRRSSRLTERVAQAENDHQKVEREYTLNLTKALKKKAEQCTYETKICEVLKGGNRVFQMSAGIYELYKMSLMSHFEVVMKNEDLPQVVQIKSVKDKKGRIVESQVKVNQRKTSKGLGLHKYTVNLYHTRSSMMVNGREAGTFTEAHKAALGHIINIQNLDSIDDELHSILVGELEKIQLDPISPTPQERSVKEKVQNLKALTQGSGAITQMRDQSPNVSQQFLCLHCEQSAQMNVIECSFCTNWFHFDCEGLSEEEFQSYDADIDRDYTCVGCRVQNQAAEMATEEKDEDLQLDDSLVPTSNNQVSVASDIAMPSKQDNPVARQEVVVPDLESGNASNHKSVVVGSGTVCKQKGNARKTQTNKAQDNRVLEIADTASSRLDTSPIPTNQNIPDTHSQDVPDVLAEQMLKSKEKLLNTRERKLKELEKKLHLKEISLSDQIQQNDFSKAYIVTMENKVKELERSNRLMKMKLLSQIDASIDVPTTDPTLSNLPQQPTNVHQRQETPLQDRVVNLELKLLEHRIYQLEQSSQYNQSYYSPSDVPCHWAPYYVGSGFPVYYHGNYGRYNAYPYNFNIESAPYTRMYYPYPLTHMQSSSLQSDPRPLILTTTLTQSLMKQVYVPVKLSHHSRVLLLRKQQRNVKTMLLVKESLFIFPAEAEGKPHV